jgi:hypothetical protein
MHLQPDAWSEALPLARRSRTREIFFATMCLTSNPGRESASISTKKICNLKYRDHKFQIRYFKHHAVYRLLVFWELWMLK